MAWTIHNVTREHRAPLMGWDGHNWRFLFFSLLAQSPLMAQSFGTGARQHRHDGHVFIRPVSQSTNMHSKFSVQLLLALISGIVKD